MNQNISRRRRIESEPSTSTDSENMGDNKRPRTDNGISEVIEILSTSESVHESSDHASDESSESENEYSEQDQAPALIPAASKSADGKKESNTVECSICDHVLHKDHIGVLCTQDHHMCSTCAASFVRTALEDPATLIPPKCPICKTDLVGGSFERQLDEPQRNLYLSYVAMKEVEEGMRIANCPSCPYFEIWPDGHTGMDLFFCKSISCEKTTCAHCKAECAAPEQGGFTDRDLREACADSSSFMFHTECAALVADKKVFDDAISKGTGMTCPHCGHFGRKDDACTHIRCVQCQTRYCYVCGLDETSCDKRDRNGDIYSHNQDWEINPRRCPMFLTQVREIDDRWGQADDECVAFISRIRTLELLRTAHRRIGPESFHKLFEKYDSVRNCGFSIEDILNWDLTLIRRPVSY